MIKVIEAKKIDIPEIVEVWKEFMDFHKERDPFFSRREDGHINFKKFIEESIESDDVQVLVAFEDNKIIGYYRSSISKYPPVFEQSTYGFISDVAVKDGYRRKGIGEKFLMEIKKWFSGKGITRVELYVSSKNEVASSFWKKHGFKAFKHAMYLEM